MATFTLTINTDNAAFEGEQFYPEMRAVLDKVAIQVADYFRENGSVRDTNGNTVGRFELSED